MIIYILRNLFKMENMVELYNWMTTWDRYVKRTTPDEPKQDNNNGVRRKVRVPKRKKTDEE